jgi:toxin ParE1/3/4
MAGCRLRPKAVEDLQAIGDLIAIDDPARAVSFVEEIASVLDRIAARPRAFQRRDDLAPGLRQAVHGQYLVLFTAAEEDVVVERVLHGARRLEDLI